MQIKTRMPILNVVSNQESQGAVWLPTLCPSPDVINSPRPEAVTWKTNLFTLPAHCGSTISSTQCESVTLYPQGHVKRGPVGSQGTFLFNVAKKGDSILITSSHSGSETLHLVQWVIRCPGCIPGLLNQSCERRARNVHAGKKFFR